MPNKRGVMRTSEIPSQYLQCACFMSAISKTCISPGESGRPTTEKQFSMNDYCFALQSYPKWNYEQLRDLLVLQYITSSIDKDQVLRETFDKVQTLQQKNVFLLVDEVQIRPTVSISGGLLSGMAENMSILCILTTTLTLFAVNPSEKD
ncbi:hypothetical protein FHG87_023203 [Trinorchestia longiramus]|nr:hypothetical protein FHG87_023203 [Trinorchestia longiramus]